MEVLQFWNQKAIRTQAAAHKRAWTLNRRFITGGKAQKKGSRVRNDKNLITDVDGCLLLVFRANVRFEHHSLGYHESNRYENADERREYSDEEERLDLFALPQLDGSLAAFDESELHNVEHEYEFHDGQD